MSAEWLTAIGTIVLAGGTLILAVVAVVAAYFGFRQLRAYKLFEMMKYLEDEDFRTFRRIVIMEITPIRHTPWWKNNDRLEQAAAAVCTRYDILGLMIEFDTLDRVFFPKTSYGTFFTTHWANSIIDCHHALENYLEHRHDGAENAYIHFTRLRDAAKNAGSGKV